MNKCDTCIHANVCKLSADYQKMSESVKTMASDNFKTELQCKYYQDKDKSMFNIERVL